MSSELPSPSIFVKNLHASIDHETLKNVFSVFGPVKSCKLVCDQQSGISTGSACVHFLDVRTAQKAKIGVDGMSISNKTVSVEFIQPPAKQTALPLLSVLKRDNKGWNVALFECSSKLTNVLCEHCNSVCCDAVELDCDHDDDDIFLYCKDCLHELIMNKNGRCAINGHENPIVTANRASRRQILTSIVCCPFSTSFKSKTKQLNEGNIDMVAVTEGNEGENDNHILTGSELPSSSSECTWRGTLSALIDQHLQECANKRDPLLSYKSQIQVLQEQNEKLREDLSKQIQCNNQLQIKINECQHSNQQPAAIAYTHNVQCNDCAMYPIHGIRYVCSMRANYNICANCESRLMREGKLQYPLYKIYRPQSTAPMMQSPAMLQQIAAQQQQQAMLGQMAAPRVPVPMQHVQIPQYPPQQQMQRAFNTDSTMSIAPAAVSVPPPQSGSTEQLSPNAVALQSSPLTAEMLQDVKPAERKRLIGERLFAKIQAVEPKLAGKVTGMLLEMANSELLPLLSNQRALINKINEALAVMKDHQHQMAHKHEEKRAEKALAATTSDGIRELVDGAINSCNKKKTIWIKYNDEPIGFQPRPIKPQFWEERPVSFFATFRRNNLHVQERFYLNKIVEVRRKTWKISKAEMKEFQVNYKQNQSKPENVKNDQENESDHAEFLYPLQLKQLSDMGFAKDKVMPLLVKHRGNVHQVLFELV